MLMHLGGLFGGIIVPLVMWLIKRRESWFVDYHGRQALNLHLSMMLYLLCAFFTIVFLIGILALPAVVICFIGYSIAATQAAHRGQLIRCPLSIRFLLEPRPQNW